MFVFGDFNVCRKDCLTYFGGTDGLTQMVNFPTWFADSDSLSPALLDLFISSDASICSTMAFPWEILIIFSQFPLTFQ